MSFVQGGVGEVKIGDILDRNKGFWTQAEKEAVASAHEARHPGVVVIRDWETQEQFETRREGRPVVVTAPPTMGMDPERAVKELRRQYANLASLELKHPDYRKLWTNTVNVIHELEDIVGIRRTEYQFGHRPARPDDRVPPELQERLNKYGKLPQKKRQQVIEETKDLALLKLIRDFEPIFELQELTITRLAVVGAI